MSVLSVKQILICPYCGTSQEHVIDVHAHTYKQVIRCCIEDGGCDGDFVLGARYRLDLTYQKVEGEPV